MPTTPYRAELVRNYLRHLLIRDLSVPLPNIDEAIMQTQYDFTFLAALMQARYLRARPPILKVPNLHLAWEYAQSPDTHDRFINMLRLTPEGFQVLLNLINDHPVFFNNSQNPQAPVEQQLAVTLYRMGRYGNGASVEDIARVAGVSEGSVVKFTDRCFTAIESLHDIFVRPLTPEEKEVEKKWMDEHLGFRGTWRNGWVMYDGTIVVLYARPGQNGDAYYTRKGNYGLNLQVGNIPSTLRIVDYSHGLVGSAHDASAFEHTAAFKYPDWFFDEGQFAWADSAYPCNSRTIPVHKKPASLLPNNMLFDAVVAGFRVRCEHCMGALKGRWQCLRGLRVPIRNNHEHVQACRWITIAIILHNLCIDVDGVDGMQSFIRRYGQEEGPQHVAGEGVARVDNNEKRQALIDELVAFRSM